MRTHPTASSRAGRVRTFRYPGGCARVGSYRGRTDIGQLLFTGCPPPTPVIERAVSHLETVGYEEVLTGPLPPRDEARVITAGFSPRAHLHLLRHELAWLPPAGLRTRRARRADLQRIVELDDIAFDEFWRLGAVGIREAAAATPRSRIRTAFTGHDLLGYAISGLSGSTGYLQRLAVRPDARGGGLGRSLVVDGLHWLRRHGAAYALVNTQHANMPALGLYESVGFRRLPDGLTVLGRAIG